MPSYDIRKDNSVGGRAFITVQPIKKLKDRLKKWALETTGWKVKGDDSGATHDISKLDEKDEAVKEKTFYKSLAANEEGLECTFIATYSLKYRDYLRNQRKKNVEKAKEEVERNNSNRKKKPSSGRQRFIRSVAVTEAGEEAKPVYSIDEEMIKEDEKYDGYYCICTNLEDDPVEILTVNSIRWIIEVCFRVMKTDFSARPVYVRVDEAIRAHFLTCFLALLTVTLLMKKVNRGTYNFSPNTIAECLCDMNAYVIPGGQGYAPSYFRTPLIDALNATADIRTNVEAISRKSMRNMLRSVSDASVKREKKKSSPEEEKK